MGERTRSGFVLAGDVEGGEVGGSGIGLKLAGVVAEHELAAAGIEEATFAEDGFVEVFAGDDGVVAAEAVDLGLEEAAVVGVAGDDGVGVEEPDTLPAVCLLAYLEFGFL